jgi:hypothetical protein
MRDGVGSDLEFIRMVATPKHAFKKVYKNYDKQ